MYLIARAHANERRYKKESYLFINSVKNISFFSDAQHRIYGIEYNSLHPRAHYFPYLIARP